MRGQLEGGTRRLNRHWQSSEGVSSTSSFTTLQMLNFLRSVYVDEVCPDWVGVYIDHEPYLFAPGYRMPDFKQDLSNGINNIEGAYRAYNSSGMSANIEVVEIYKNIESIPAIGKNFVSYPQFNWLESYPNAAYEGEGFNIPYTFRNLAKKGNPITVFPWATPNTGDSISYIRGNFITPRYSVYEIAYGYSQYGSGWLFRNQGDALSDFEMELLEKYSGNKISFPVTLNDDTILMNGAYNYGTQTNPKYRKFAQYSNLRWSGIGRKDVINWYPIRPGFSEYAQFASDLLPEGAVPNQHNGYPNGIGYCYNSFTSYARDLNNENPLNFEGYWGYADTAIALYNSVSIQSEYGTRYFLYVLTGLDFRKDVQANAYY